MTLKLGCIADDFAGGTDLANNLVRVGTRTVQVIGAPDAASPAPDADAVVVALESRTAPVDEAVAQSLASAHWLRAMAAAQIYFKVCSTFDSTPRGNIGLVDYRGVAQGADAIGLRIDDLRALARAAATLPLVVAGSGLAAEAQRLGIKQLRIGPQIDPGVPWCHTATPARAAGLHLALKSGNFGGTDFFTRAFRMQP